MPYGTLLITYFTYNIFIMNATLLMSDFAYYGFYFCQTLLVTVNRKRASWIDGEETKLCLLISKVIISKVIISKVILYFN